MVRFRFLLLILVVITLPFMLFGCGSGGGSGGGSGSDSNTSSSMGTAAVLIKDAPTEEYDSIVLCISKATLEPGSVTLFESDSCVEIDLLDHQEKPFLLTVKDIPAGTYNKIILNVMISIQKVGLAILNLSRFPADASRLTRKALLTSIQATKLPSQLTFMLKDRSICIPQENQENVFSDQLL